ncbi:unnamed protein product [Mycena citricolor]|uniref:Uncharacterized protein n=1 Tax=Mycena citricolor TaxID=2018698 RepID=A0AAD2HY74_9AGAR|nr:unnamed protein product [Mycena citricolor]
MILVLHLISSVNVDTGHRAARPLSPRLSKKRRGAVVAHPRPGMSVSQNKARRPPRDCPPGSTGHIDALYICQVTRGFTGTGPRSTADSNSYRES